MITCGEPAVVKCPTHNTATDLRAQALVTACLRVNKAPISLNNDETSSLTFNVKNGYNSLLLQREVALMPLEWLFVRSTGSIRVNIKHRPSRT